MSVFFVENTPSDATAAATTAQFKYKPLFDVLKLYRSGFYVDLAVHVLRGMFFCASKLEYG